MKKIKLIILLFLLSFSFLQVRSVEAYSYYTGVGISRAGCSIRRVLTTQTLRQMGLEWQKANSQMGYVTALVALTPKFGPYLSSLAGVMTAYAGNNANAFLNAADRGLSFTEYYCEKLQWDGYSRKSWIEYKLF